jgi:hypothetical protein
MVALQQRGQEPGVYHCIGSVSGAGKAVRS